MRHEVWRKGEGGEGEGVKRAAGVQKEEGPLISEKRSRLGNGKQPMGVGIGAPHHSLLSKEDLERAARIRNIKSTVGKESFITGSIEDDITLHGIITKTVGVNLVDCQKGKTVNVTKKMIYLSEYSYLLKTTKKEETSSLKSAENRAALAAARISGREVPALKPLGQGPFELSHVVSKLELPSQKRIAMGSA